MLNDRQRKLVEDNYHLIKRCLRLMKAYPIEDYTGLAGIALCEASERYVENEQTKFSTYATTYINNKIKTEFKKNARYRIIVSLEMPDEDIINNIDLISIYKFDDEIVHDLSLKDIHCKLGDDKYVILQMILEGYRLNEIAIAYGCTFQYISKVFKEIKKKLKILV